MLGAILTTLIIASLIGLFIWGMIWAVYVMFKKPIECPVCGRNFKGAGKKPKCYKCGTDLIRHKNGKYVIRNSAK